VTGEDGQGMLSIHNLAKSYKADVVEDVSFYVKRGEAVGLLGPKWARNNCFLHDHGSW